MRRAGPWFVLSALLLVGCATGLPGAGPIPALPSQEPWSKVADFSLVRQQGRSDCGGAALAMVLAHYDRAADGTQLARQMGQGADDSHGIPAGHLRDVALARGLEAYVIEASFADLDHEIERGHPVLVGLYRIVGDRGYPHYEVVTGINPRDHQLLIADPATGWRKEGFAPFLARWQPAHQLAVVIFPAAPVSGNPPVARDDDHR